MRACPIRPTWAGWGRPFFYLWDPHSLPRTQELMRSTIFRVTQVQSGSLSSTPDYGHDRSGLGERGHSMP